MIFLGSFGRGWPKSTTIFKDVVGIIKIAKSNKIDGPKKKLDGASQQNSSSQHISRDKERKKFGPLYQHKRQAEGTTPNNGGTQGRKPPNIINKESNFLVLGQIIFVR